MVEGGRCYWCELWGIRRFSPLFEAGCMRVLKLGLHAFGCFDAEGGAAVFEDDADGVDEG